MPRLFLCLTFALCLPCAGRAADNNSAATARHGEQQHHAAAVEQGSDTEAQGSQPTTTATTAVPASPSATNQPPGDPKAGERQGWCEWWRQVGRASTFTDWVVAVATFVYALVAIGQLCAVQRQADIAERQVKLSEDQARHAAVMERPWLFVECTSQMPPKGWNPEKDTRGEWRDVAVSWNLVNRGQSHAWVVRVVAKVEVLTRDQVMTGGFPPFDVSGPKTAGLAIPPNGTHGSETVGHLRHADMQRVMAGDGALICYGVVLYRDGFMKADDAAHETRFAMTWVANISQALGGTPGLVYSPVGPPDWTRYT